MISVRCLALLSPLSCVLLGCIGLIGQVAEELWEVADKTIHNLTKQEIDIVGYKRNLIKQSKSKWYIFDICSSGLKGYAAIEKAKLFSKTAPKGKT